MADQRKPGGIAWTDESWNPVRGCSRVSEGCRHCYAEVRAARFSGPGLPYEGLATYVAGEARWTGTLTLVSEKLVEPLSWRRPRRVFVNSMSDLFHEGLSDEQIAEVFGVMYACLGRGHAFQILTKRAYRLPCALAAVREHLGTRVWPLPNVWLGVSVEDQRAADERIPLLLQTPAAVRWVSYEPALGPVDFRPWLHRVGLHMDGTHDTERLDWIVVGGESGPRARPLDLAWVRATIARCRAAGVPVFVKQLGRSCVDSEWSAGCYTPYDRRAVRAVLLHDPKGADPSEWPEALRERALPATTTWRPR